MINERLRGSCLNWQSSHLSAIHRELTLEKNEQQKPSILIVDDDKNLVGTFRKFFEIKKFTVDTACAGCEAVLKIEALDYDIAIIDVSLPDMKGTELLLRFRKTIPSTRKIILTGYASTEAAMDAVNNGASFFLSKPVRLDRLLDVVNNQLEERTREMELCRQKGMGILAKN